MGNTGKKIQREKQEDLECGIRERSREIRNGDLGRFGRERRNQAEIYEDAGKKRPERGGGERYKEIRNITQTNLENNARV
jgi:hypothetical protein